MMLDLSSRESRIIQLVFDRASKHHGLEGIITHFLAHPFTCGWCHHMNTGFHLSVRQDCDPANISDEGTVHEPQPAHEGEDRRHYNLVGVSCQLPRWKIIVDNGSAVFAAASRSNESRIFS